LEFNPINPWLAKQAESFAVIAGEAHTLLGARVREAKRKISNRFFATTTAFDFNFLLCSKKDGILIRLLSKSSPEVSHPVGILFAATEEHREDWSATCRVAVGK